MLANFFVCVCVVVLFFNVRETRGGLFTGTCELGSLSTCVTRLRSSIVRLFFLLRGRSSSKETMWPSPRCDVMNRNPELIDIDSNFNYVFTLVLSAWQCPPLMNCYRFYVPFFFFFGSAWMEDSFSSSWWQKHFHRTLNCASRPFVIRAAVEKVLCNTSTMCSCWNSVDYAFPSIVWWLCVH